MSSNILKHRKKHLPTNAPAAFLLPMLRRKIGKLKASTKAKAARFVDLCMNLYKSSLMKIFLKKQKHFMSQI
jgi:hypothetical protein